LLYFRTRLAVIVGLIAGLIYFIVDYGIFYKLLGTRQIVGADPFWFLSWCNDAHIMCWLFICYLQKSEKNEQVNIIRLIFIGIGVQFAWELSLLINGIRPPLWQPLVINSLIETNLGMLYIYYIHKSITKYWKEDLTRVKQYL